VVAVATHDTASAIAAVPASNEPFAFLDSQKIVAGNRAVRTVANPEDDRMEYSNAGGVGSTHQFLKNIMGFMDCPRM
jgi:rhamnulokinase